MEKLNLSEFNKAIKQCEKNGEEVVTLKTHLISKLIDDFIVLTAQNVVLISKLKQKGVSDQEINSLLGLLKNE